MCCVMVWWAAAETMAARKQMTQEYWMRGEVLFLGEALRRIAEACKLCINKYYMIFIEVLPACLSGCLTDCLPHLVHCVCSNRTRLRSA